MVLERRIKKRNLNQLDILINDTSNEFLQVFDVVDTLPQGRSSFTINGSEFLKTNTEVLVEILDNNNNPIFVNPIYDPEYVTMQGTSRSISVEIYPTTPPGRAVLTIVGELDHEKFIGLQIANVLSGEDADVLDEVDEEYILKLESKAIQTLFKQPKSQERIETLLETGKVIRN